MIQTSFIDDLRPASSRDQALDLFEIHKADWLAKARACAVAIYLQRKSPITVNDLRAVCPPLEDSDPRIMGAVFRSPQWEAVGFEQSDRRTCHGRPIRLFQLRGGEA